MPKVRNGGYVPAFLDERFRSERALISVVQQAGNGGLATRRVEKLFSALGTAGISKSQVSDLCQELDEMATAFRKRPLTKAYPYVMLDAMYEKVRIAKQDRDDQSSGAPQPRHPPPHSGRRIFPNIESALRIITIRLIEETENWSTGRRYMDADLLASLDGPGYNFST